MSISPKCSCLFTWKSFFRLVILLFFSIILTFNGIWNLSSINAAPAFVWLVLRSYDRVPNENHTSYIVVTYKGTDGHQSDYVSCRPIVPQNYIEIPDQIKAGQTISISYYSSSQCDQSTKIFGASPKVPENPSSNLCWFNPNNDLNWGGCVNPSQHVNLTLRTTLPVDSLDSSTGEQISQHVNLTLRTEAREEETKRDPSKKTPTPTQQNKKPSVTPTPTQQNKKPSVTPTPTNTIQFVGLSVHSYDQGNYNGKKSYVTLTYTDGNGDKRAHVSCQLMQPQSWYDIPVNSFVKVGTSIWIRYFSHDAQCRPSDQFLEANPQVPQNPSSNHCWFNPNPTANDLNWGGCVNSSQHVDMTLKSSNPTPTPTQQNKKPSVTPTPTQQNKKPPVTPTPTNTIQFVGLSLRSYDQTPNEKHSSYIVVTYQGADGNKRDHVFCQSIASQSWYDIPVSDFIKVGQTISIRYYSNSKCNPSDELLQASPMVPQNPSSNHCWFNPNPTANDLNWGGCVNSSQHVNMTLKSSNPTPTPTQPHKQPSVTPTPTQPHKQPSVTPTPTNTIKFVGLSLRSYDQAPNEKHTSYIVVTYQGADGNKRDHVFCQPIAFQSWYDIPVPDFIKAGQTIWIRYYSNSKCDPSNGLLQAFPMVPQNPSSNHCMFNPNPTVNDLNWGGCVNPSQSVPLFLGNILHQPNVSGTPNASGMQGLLGLSLHSDDQTNQMNYIKVTYKGADGNQRDHVLCQSLPSQSWYDIPVSNFMEAGQTITIRYYSSPQCNPSSLLLQASPMVPQNPSFNHCWFNPNPTVNDLNWSGCVNPSQHVDLTFPPNINKGGTVHVYLNRPTDSVFGSAYLMVNGMISSKCITVSQQNVDTFVGDYPAPLKNVSLAMFTDASCGSVANYNGPKADLNDPGHAVLTLQQYTDPNGGCFYQLS